MVATREEHPALVVISVRDPLLHLRTTSQALDDGQWNCPRWRIEERIEFNVDMPPCEATVAAGDGDELGICGFGGEDELGIWGLGSVS